MAEDGKQVEGELFAFSQKQLVELAKSFGIPGVDDNTDKPIIVRNLLRGMNFTYTTTQTRLSVKPTPPPPKPVKPATEQLYQLLKTYVKDEVMLLRAVASMLETLSQNADMMLDQNNENQVAKYAYDLTHELEYFQAHTSHARFLSIYRMIRPPPKYDE